MGNYYGTLNQVIEFNGSGEKTFAFGITNKEKYVLVKFVNNKWVIVSELAEFHRSYSHHPILSIDFYTSVSLRKNYFTVIFGKTSTGKTVFNVVDHNTKHTPSKREFHPENDWKSAKITEKFMVKTKVYFGIDGKKVIDHVYDYCNA